MSTNMKYGKVEDLIKNFRCVLFCLKERFKIISLTPLHLQLVLCRVPAVKRPPYITHSADLFYFSFFEIKGLEP